MLKTLAAGTGSAARAIAVLEREGAGPPVVWCGGFRSDMRATKATALDEWAATRGRHLVRFDYAGHGESGGDFEACTISTWLEDALTVLERLVPEPPVLVGSSMGGWIALLATRALRERAPERAPRGLVLVAPAPDFTERLMWAAFPEDIRRAILETGRYLRPSLYDERPYPITRALIEDGRRHLLLDGPIATGCPVHILQGMQDPDVPWEHAMTLLEHLPGEDVAMTLVKDGDHRLSRPEDIERLVRAVEAIA
ncbi:MAG TPA: alpha/beta hydrolase [Salinarimonas sp.]|jgi:pimeloyl-ACP methyl ester carboxylesterase|nr:alpha/beta hydrolase [Salinarimonas sp.]